MNNGFLLVASVYKPYLTSAQMLADSIREYMDTNITLFTIDEWVNDSGNHVFDNVIGGAPHSKRAKLWALSQTPYDTTVYCDADMQCVHSNVRKIFNLIDTYDIVFTKIRPYSAAKIWWKGVTESHPHGGFFIYKKNDRMISFMEQWWENWKWFKIHKMTPRWEKLYHSGDIADWDQFPLGLMLGVNDKMDPWYRPDILWNYIQKNDCLWNYCHTYDHLTEKINLKDIIFRANVSVLYNRESQFYREYKHNESTF